MSTLVRTYDPELGQENLEEHLLAPRYTTHGIMPARVALQSVKARVREMNRRQNFIRWSVDRTAIAGTWNPTTLYPVLFDTEHFGTEDLKGRWVDCDPTVSWKFICGEPGWHDIDGHITHVISYPAVPFTKVSSTLLYLRVRSFKYNTITLYEQDREFASCGVAGGLTVQHYLRAWTLHIVDQIYLEPGDEVEAYWMFQGAGAISFIEEYTGHIAIQKTGEKYIDGSCCHG